MRPWFMAAPEALENLQSTLRAHYPLLHMKEEDGKIVVAGVFLVVSEGDVLDRYLIRIELPDAYPHWYPRVWEVGGRIPRINDRHINGDGSLCLGVPDDLWIKLGGDFELCHFLAKPVRAFLIGNSLVERGEMWPQDERPHGKEGICEFYGELVGFSNPQQIRLLLTYLAKKDDIKGHWLCPCQSGSVLRKCHFSEVLGLRQKIPPHVASESLKYFLK